MVRHRSSSEPATSIGTLLAFFKKPATWLFSIAAGVLATAVAGILTDAFDPVTKRVAVLACSFSFSPPSAADDGRFTILVSPLAGDKNNAMTDLVVRAFLQDTEIFRVVRICESLDITTDSDLDRAKQKTLKQAADLIKKNHADLLLFGSVNPEHKSLSVWAVNEHGGCGFDPNHPIVLQQGVLPAEFDQQTKDEFINRSLEEIAAACDNPDQVDWALFAKRVAKLATFVERIRAALPADQAESLTSAYAMAMALTFQHTSDSSWFDKATKFDLKQIESIRTDTPDRNKSTRWGDYGALLMAKADNSNSADDRSAAIRAFEKAFSFEPKNDRTLWNLGYLYAKQKNYDKVIHYRTLEIQIDPDTASHYLSRGDAYANKGDYDHAAQDYRQVLRLQPSNSDAHDTLCFTEALNGQFQQAIADCDESIRLSTKPPAAYFPYFTRGRTKFYTGAFADALADLNQASKLVPRNAYVALWIDIVSRRSQVLSPLSEAVSQLDMAAWPAPIVNMFLGRMTLDAVLAAAADPDPDKKRGNVCEANFYGGELSLRQGSSDDAKRLFQLASSDCPHNFVESEASNAELKALGRGQ